MKKENVLSFLIGMCFCGIIWVCVNSYNKEEPIIHSGSGQGSGVTIYIDTSYNKWGASGGRGTITDSLIIINTQTK